LINDLNDEAVRVEVTRADTDHGIAQSALGALRISDN
jgi:hypothetical protein